MQNCIDAAELPFLAGDEIMNIFLVDDELLIREDIKAFYAWEREGFHIIGEAPNANAAKHYAFANTLYASCRFQLSNKIIA